MLWKTTSALNTAFSVLVLKVPSTAVILLGIIRFVVQYIWVASWLEKAEIVSKVYKDVGR